MVPARLVLLLLLLPALLLPAGTALGICRCAPAVSDCCDTVAAPPAESGCPSCAVDHAAPDRESDRDEGEGREDDGPVAGARCAGCCQVELADDRCADVLPGLTVAPSLPATTWTWRNEPPTAAAAETLRDPTECTQPRPPDRQRNLPLLL